MNMKNSDQRNRIVIALAIILVLYTIFEFIRNIYAIHKGDVLGFNLTNPVFSALYYLIAIPLIFSVKKLVTEIREKPLGIIFIFFIINYIIAAIVVTGSGIHRNLFDSCINSASSESSDSAMFEIYKMFEHFFRIVNIYLDLFLNLFLFIFSVNLLLPDRGNNGKVRVLGISIFVYLIINIIFSMLFSHLYTGNIDLICSEDEETSALYTQKYITLYYIYKSCYVFSILGVSLSIIYLARAKSFSVAILNRAKVYAIGRICCIAGVIVIIPTIIVLDMLKGMGEYYMLFPELLLSLVFIAIFILLAYYYHSRGKEKVRKGFEKLAYLQALLIIPYVSFMLHSFQITESSKINEDLNYESVAHCVVYGLIALLIYVTIFIFYIRIGRRLLKDSLERLDHALAYTLFAAIGASILGFILTILAELTDFENLKIMRLVYLPSIVMLVISYMLLSTKKEL